MSNTALSLAFLSPLASGSRPKPETLAQDPPLETLTLTLTPNPAAAAAAPPVPQPPAPAAAAAEAEAASPLPTPASPPGTTSPSTPPRSGGGGGGGGGGGELFEYGAEEEDGVAFDAALDEEEFVEDGEFEGDVKEKGVPAVMRCFDTAKIYVKAGDGGNGVVAFRREKFVPYGGPSGGDGGRGGDVYIEVDGSMNSLLPFRKAVHFRAGRGGHGLGRKQGGAKGENVVVMVPPGTVIRESQTGAVLLELMRAGERALLLPGGRGGRGNASFKSGLTRSRRLRRMEKKVLQCMWLDLELKLVADVGIVGAPNAGKSTLLSAISAAQPAIANYPFTTLLPNLGVVSLDFDATMVVADLPGLLEGAHRGFGLGHEFLRHSERCSVLVHVVDGSGQQPEYEFDAVRLELELFSPSLAEKPYIIVYNKMDLPEAYDRWDLFKEHLQSRGIQSYCISAMNRQGTHDVVCAAYEILRKEREEKKEVEEWRSPVNLNHVADTIQRQRSTSMNEFEIFHDSSTNTWHVFGAGIQRFVQMTNWQYTESLRRFQHALDACGVNKSLIKRGVKEGDTVIVGEVSRFSTLPRISRDTSVSDAGIDNFGTEMSYHICYVAYGWTLSGRNRLEAGAAWTGFKFVLGRVELGWSHQRSGPARPTGPEGTGRAGPCVGLAFKVLFF
uniref:GTP-binding protein OBGC1, chloroplastic n=1 Tax=Ananas comosus var. bracteatus TaxID=296719 RepID=A0A6V7PR63_ANACO|nr:unnamed protein product [Ananas comosus var. bracteatus]